MKLAVIGAGASGSACVIEALLTNPNISITLYDKMPKVCKKILATGNGRCNFTNENLSPSHFYGNTAFLRKILTSVFADSCGFFREMGVLTYTEDGRIYPRSQQAVTIRDTLENAIRKQNVTLRLEEAVTSIKKVKNGYIVNGEEFHAVVICGGGKSSPSQGSDGSCFEIVKELGHTVTPLYPALCGLTTNDKALKSLKGVRAQSKATLLTDGSVLGYEIGEVQFTDKGISGIPVMNLSHLCKNNKNLTLSLDLTEELSFEELTSHIETTKNNCPDIEAEAILGGIINTKLVYVVMSASGIKPHTFARELNTNKIKAICNELKNFEFNITGTRGFDNSQITCGGVLTEEINPETMMSTICDGLFICGEMLDLHGDCGGYNLHLAWTTGRIAGFSAGKFLKQ